MGLRMMGSRDSTEKYASVPFVAAFETVNDLMRRREFRSL